MTGPMVRRASCLAAALFAISAAAAHAQDAGEEKDLLPGKFGGSATLTSDYVFRGISQSDENPAVQASLEWSHDSGLFAGAWASSVDFNDGDEASVEIDWYAGARRTYWGFNFDLRGIFYHYPGADVPRDYNYWEVALAVSREVVPNLTLGAGYNYSPEFFAESGDAHYLHAEAWYTLNVLPVPLKLAAGVGRQYVDDNAAFGAPDYWHWTGGVSVTVEGLELALAYHDTDIDESECAGGLDTCGGRVVASATYAF